MKRFVLLYCVLLCCCAVHSQVNTLMWGQREPTFYYWDSNYADCYGEATATPLTMLYSQIVARRCYVDTTLKVIGIAAPVSKMVPLPYYRRYYRDSLDLNREPEYFMLYEATDSSFDLRAKVRYDTNQPRYRMMLPDVFAAEDRYHYPPERTPYVYEAYFDKPIVVRDSFYVGVTNFNNDWVYNADSMRYESGGHYRTTYYEIALDRTVYHVRDFFKVRSTNPFNRPMRDTSDFFRTLQETYSPEWRFIDPLSYLSGMNGFMPIFPIFDTTGLDIHGYRWMGICDTVRDLRVLRMGENNAYVCWYSDTAARWWELSYGESGVRPENGIRDTFRMSLACLRELQPGHSYDVYVRGRCKDDTRGPWAGPLTFTMAGSSDGVEPLSTAVDRNTYVMPNPTDGPITVFSGFRISTVEVYNITGTHMATIAVNANVGSIDASSWQRGAYILRIRTSHGDTAQRLIKK